MSAQKNKSKGRLEKFDIYVQTEPFPCNRVAQHPCEGVGSQLPQNEARAALCGYLLGILNQQHNYALIKPFFVSELRLLKLTLRTDIEKEVVNRGYSLPSDFDPIIFAFKSENGENLFTKEYKDNKKIEWELNFFFNMKRIERK